VKVGVNAIALSLPFGKASTPQEVIDIVSKSGIKYLTIPVRSPKWGINPETITTEEISKIRNAFSKDVVSTGLGYCWPSNYTMVTASKSEYDRNLNYANKLCELALALDARHIVIGAPGRSIPQNISYYDGVKKLVEFWKEVSLYAKDNGIGLYAEHTSKERCNFGTTTKSLIDLVDAVDSPSFQMIAQIKDMVINDLDVVDAIRAAGDRIKQVHIADVSGLDPLCESWSPFMLPGKGVLDFVSIFRALKDIGYNGEICIEAIIGDDPVSDLKETSKYIQSKWRQA
jgi:sugar phosphate isomerase/epimerase